MHSGKSCSPWMRRNPGTSAGFHRNLTVSVPCFFPPGIKNSCSHEQERMTAVPSCFACSACALNYSLTQNHGGDWPLSEGASHFPVRKLAPAVSSLQAQDEMLLIFITDLSVCYHNYMRKKRVNLHGKRIVESGNDLLFQGCIPAVSFQCFHAFQEGSCLPQKHQ